MDEQQNESQVQEGAPLDQEQKPAPLAAPAPGTVIPAATTIDAIFTTVYGTRSSDIAATPTYTWAGPFSILANWPTLVTPQNINNNSQMMARFEMRQMAPSSIAP